VRDWRRHRRRDRVRYKWRETEGVNNWTNREEVTEEARQRERQKTYKRGERERETERDREWNNREWNNREIEGGIQYRKEDRVGRRTVKQNTIHRQEGGQCHCIDKPQHFNTKRYGFDAKWSLICNHICKRFFVTLCEFIRRMQK
jgi:hypothetical protein